MTTQQQNQPSTFVVWAALVCNLLVAATKLAAALYTGSTALLSEAVHSFVDTGNEVLLLYGLHRAERLPTRRFPFGFGREVYFWSFVVAILVFAVGACVALYKGVNQWRTPEELEDPAIIYAVLGLSALFEGATWIIALRDLRRTARRRSLWTALMRSKDPPKFVVLLEDTAALLGIVIAVVGTAVALHTGDARWDGAASVLIGLLLAAMAVLLAAKTKDLLIGEEASPALVKSALAVIAGFDGVENANGMLTAQLAPDQVIAIASIAFKDTLRTPQIEQLVEDIEQAVVARHPEVGRLFVKPQTPAAYQAALKLRFQSGVTPKAQARRRRREKKQSKPA